MVGLPLLVRPGVLIPRGEIDADRLADFGGLENRGIYVEGRFSNREKLVCDRYYRPGRDHQPYLDPADCQSDFSSILDFTANWGPPGKIEAVDHPPDELLEQSPPNRGLRNLLG